MDRRYFLGGLAALAATPRRSEARGDRTTSSLRSDSPAMGCEVCDVKKYGAKGDGTTQDSSAITTAAADLRPGGILYFPPAIRGYYVGTDVFALPDTCLVVGVAGFDALRRGRLGMMGSGGLALVPDANGLLAAQRGYLFDGAAGRILYQPNSALVFAGNAVAGRNGGEYLVALQMRNGPQWNVRTAWSTDNLATLYASNWIAPAEHDQYDPELLLMPNGRILCGFHSSATNGLDFVLSIDGGRTWVTRTTLTPPGSHQRWRSVKMIRLRQAVTGQANRVVILFSDYDTQAEAIRYRTAFTDDEALSWSPTTVAVDSAVGGAVNQINDADHGCLFEDASGAIQLLVPFKHDGHPGAIYHESCNAVGQSPFGSPSLVTVIPRLSGSGMLTRVGGFPHVVPLMTGEFGLYFTAQDCGTGGNAGELHFMSSKTGAKGTFVADRRVFTATGYRHCYGFVRPSRKQDGTLELIHVAVLSETVSQVRSVIHYGA